MRTHAFFIVLATHASVPGWLVIAVNLVLWFAVSFVVGAGLGLGWNIAS